MPGVPGDGEDGGCVAEAGPEEHQHHGAGRGGRHQPRAGGRAAAGVRGEDDVVVVIVQPELVQERQSCF